MQITTTYFLYPGLLVLDMLNLDDKVDFSRDICSVIFRFDDKPAAEAFVAQFPKFCKMRVVRSYPGYQFAVRWERNRNMHTDGSTGDVNEAGAKRNAKIEQILRGIL